MTSAVGHAAEPLLDELVPELDVLPEDEPLTEEDPLADDELLTELDPPLPELVVEPELVDAAAPPPPLLLPPLTEELVVVPLDPLLDDVAWLLDPQAASRTAVLALRTVEEIARNRMFASASRNGKGRPSRTAGAIVS